MRSLVAGWYGRRDEWRAVRARERFASGGEAESRGVAALLGLVAPGLGHVFVGHTLRGAAWVVAPLVLFSLFMVLAREPSMSTVFATLGGIAFVA